MGISKKRARSQLIILLAVIRRDEPLDLPVLKYSPDSRIFFPFPDVAAVYTRLGIKTTTRPNLSVVPFSPETTLP
jgi:hypothetical protein